METSPLFPLSITEASQNIRKRDPHLHALIFQYLPEAQAESASNQASGKPLAGVPFSLKDVWDVAGIPTTGGSLRFTNQIPVQDGNVARVFKSAGALLMGKSSLSDMSVAPEAGNYLVGFTLNPIDPSRTAGGSSGGAAAAVAAKMVEFDWGTDIGGSIRLPAAYCGIYGLRLSAETWPIDRMFPPVPPSLRLMCGQGPLTQNLPKMKAVLAAAAPLKTGAAREFTFRELVLCSPDHAGDWPEFFVDAQKILTRTFGRRAKTEGTLPPLCALRNLYFEMWTSHFHEVFGSDPTISWGEAMRAVIAAVFFRGKLGDKRIFWTTAELFLFMTIGKLLVYRDPERAKKKARALRAQTEKLWAEGKVLVLPTSLITPPRPGRSNRKLKLLPCIALANLTDATALTIPFGKFPDGLPRGLQLVGPPGSEEVLIALAEKLVHEMDKGCLCGPRLRRESQRL